MDFVPLRREITSDSKKARSGGIVSAAMHDGSTLRGRQVAEDYDPTDRDAAYVHVRALQQKKEIATGLLYIDNSAADMHDVNRTDNRPLVDISIRRVVPEQRGARSTDGGVQVVTSSLSDSEPRFVVWAESRAEGVMARTPGVSIVVKECRKPGLAMEVRG